MDLKTFLENINDEITCSICQETHRQPKILPCLHTVCVDCLNTMAQRAIQSNRAAILCPMCKANIQIPQPHGNFNSLPNNIYINRLKDIVADREAASEYKVSFTPQEAGVCEVSVKVGGSDVSGSPTVFQVRRRREFLPVKVMGKRGLGNDEFDVPRCVAVNVELNEIAVVDKDNCRIQIFDRDGIYLRHFGKKGSGRGMFQLPVGIVYNKQANIIVSDVISHTISVFTKEGTFLTNLAYKGNHDGQVTQPRALSITDEGNIIVADSGNKRIQVFSPDGQLVLKFGDTGKEKLEDPEAGVYHKDHYIVTDCGAQCVKLYDRRGQFVRKFRTPKDDKGATFRPYGVTSTSCGNIIVTDHGNHRLVMFRLDGSVIATVGTEGTYLGQFKFPSDVSTLSDNTIIVCDLYNHRLQVLKHP